MLEELLGENHVDVAATYLNLAFANQSAGRLDAAATAYARAIAIWEAAVGKDHVDLARPLTGLGELELQRKAPERAIPLLERALAIASCQRQPDSARRYTLLACASADHP